MDIFKIIKSNTNIPSEYSDQVEMSKKSVKEDITDFHNRFSSKNDNLIVESMKKTSGEENIKTLILSDQNIGHIEKPLRIKKTTNKKENEIAEIKEQIKIINTNIGKILNILQK